MWFRVSTDTYAKNPLQWNGYMNFKFFISILNRFLDLVAAGRGGSGCL